jgi:hypothetical protein
VSPYPKLTGARPREVDGVVFRCYHTGIMQYVWRSDDGRLEVGNRGTRKTYYITVNGGQDRYRMWRRKKKWHAIC